MLCTSDLTVPLCLNSIWPPPGSSNRSAALLKLKKVTKALEDAETVIRIRPDWEKGYFRRASVLEEMNQLEEVGSVFPGTEGH